VTFPKRPYLRRVIKCGLTALYGVLDRVQQHLVAEWLYQELDSARLRRGHFSGHATCAPLLTFVEQRGVCSWRLGGIIYATAESPVGRDSAALSDIEIVLMIEDEGDVCRAHSFATASAV
jgi:hypothetical protein